MHCNNTIAEQLQKANIPYDEFYPSLADTLQNRICKQCGMYFASIVLLKTHLKIHKKKSMIIEKKIRPKRIAAQKAIELLILQNEEYGEFMA